MASEPRCIGFNTVLHQSERFLRGDVERFYSIADQKVCATYVNININIKKVVTRCTVRFCCCSVHKV